MLLPLLQTSRKYILIDIDTQRDILLSENSCVLNRRQLLAHIRRLMAWARHENVPVISTAEIVRNNGRTIVNHCTNGTEGQTKIRCTLLNNRTFIPADSMNYFPEDLLRTYKQVILHKRCIDPFDEPHLDRLLSEIQADEFILIGASTEGAVRATALGLLLRGKTVRIVVDAIDSHNRRDAELALRKMQIKGAELIVTEDLAGVSHLRKSRH